MRVSLAENGIVVGADNRPPMLDKTNYNSWASRMLLYIKGKPNGKLLVDSVLNGHFQYGTIVEPGTKTTPATVRARTYNDLTDEEKLRESVDIMTTNIVLQGLPQDIYNLVNHNEDAKQIWDRVTLLIQGSELSLQERESKLQGAPIQARMVKCYNCQEEGHFARQCTKPKRPKNSAWFKEKMLLTEALESGAYLDPEQLAFLADNGNTIVPAQASQEIPTPSAFQTDDLDAFNSDCDDVPSAKAVLMANLSSYDLDVLLEVPFHDTNIENAISYQSVQETQCSEQPSFVNDTEVDITSDSNIIFYEQYLQETKTPVVQSTSSSAQQDTLLMSVIEEMSSQVAKCNKVQQENIVVNETLTAELERYKEQIKLFEQRQKFDLNDREKYIDGQLRQESKQKEDKYLDEVIDLQKKNKALDNVVYKMGQSTQTMHMLTKPQAFYDETHKTALGYQNPLYLSQARWKVPALYDCNTIFKTHVALFVTDSEETLELAEESRFKILAKQNDPSLKENRVNIASVDYVALNKLFEHFVKHFLPQKQLSAEQAYWLPISKPVYKKPLVPSELVLKKEIPRELPSISLVKDSFHKIREHVNKFDKTITFHTKITRNRIGSWGVDRIKGDFEKDVKAFAQTLKEYFHKKYFEIKKKELSLDNDRLLEHIICQDVMNIVMYANDHSDNLLISQDLVHTAVNSLAAINDYKSMQQSFVDEYNETLVLKAELAKKNDMIEKVVYNELLKRCSRLKNWCISLEIKLQQSKESFQNNIPSHYQDAPEFKEFFIINELQAQLKANNVSIEKLKEYIAHIKGKNVVESVQNVQNSNVVTSKVYKLDLQPLSPLVKHNRDAHVNYLKHTQENANTLREIIEHARELRPLDSNLDSVCKFVTRIQELLVYVNETCPSTKPVSNKLVVVTPINMTRKVRGANIVPRAECYTEKVLTTQMRSHPDNHAIPRALTRHDHKLFNSVYDACKLQHLHEARNNWGQLLWSKGTPSPR
ncbi:retrovirus-related pol polyprotein from transposon TNT 1-94 [Tanacetum coccineum]